MRPMTETQRRYLSNATALVKEWMNASEVLALLREHVEAQSSAKVAAVRLDEDGNLDVTFAVDVRKAAL